jgi:hypothetical protein
VVPSQLQLCSVPPCARVRRSMGHDGMMLHSARRQDNPQAYLLLKLLSSLMCALLLLVVLLSQCCYSALQQVIAAAGAHLLCHPPCSPLSGAPFEASVCLHEVKALLTFARRRRSTSPLCAPMLLHTWHTPH